MTRTGGKAVEPFNVTQNAAASRFEMQSGEDTAVLTYEMQDGIIVLTDTLVPQALEGKGIGSALAKTGLEYARKNGLRVIAQCPFVASYIQRHPEYQDLIS
jgi:predicted GNAT family acetyltransferase